MKKLTIAIAAAVLAMAGAGTVAVAQQAQQMTPEQRAEIMRRLPTRSEAATGEEAQRRTAEVSAAVAEQERRFAAAPPVSSAPRDTAYQFEFTGLWSDRVPMTAFRGEVIMVVNTASRCGYTGFYTQLEQIYKDYHAQGFEVVGVPSNSFNQESNNAEDIQELCTLNYGVTFPMTGVTNVGYSPRVARANPNVDDRHPFYVWAQEQFGQAAVPVWNFHKILIDRQGHIIAGFATNVDPASPEVRAAITAALAQQPQAALPQTQPRG